MPIKTIKRYNRQFIKDNPDSWFVFGDNLHQRGFGGQAKEARGERNTVGIPTKRFPSMGKNAFFYDKDLKEVVGVIDKQFNAVELLLKLGFTVYWPEDGIGSGRALLKETSPAIFNYIEQKKHHLFNEYGE